MFVDHDGQLSDDLTPAAARELVLTLVAVDDEQQVELVMAGAQIDYWLPARDGGSIHVYGVA